MRARWSLVVLILTLAGCASMSPAQVDAKMRSWEGLHINELMNAWGPPTNQYEAAGKQYFSWTSQERPSGNASPSVGVSAGSYGGHMGISLGTVFSTGNSGPQMCVRSAELDASGKVSSIRWSGDPDYCDKVTPRR